MAISSVGIGSGLDVESIVTQMVDLEKRPIETLKVKAEFIDAKISVQGQIRSMVTDLNDAALKLSLDRTWNTVKVTNSNNKASASVTGQASAGTYNLNVTKLAQSQTNVSSSFAAGALMGSGGQLQFKVGNLEDNPASAKTVNIDIQTSDSLEQVAGKINSSNAGILASVITAADGSQKLMMRSRESGKDFMFEMIVSGAAAGSQLGSLAGHVVSQSAQNAEMKLNGVVVESNNNNFTSVLPGLSISVSEEGSSLLSVSQDKDAIKEAVQSFVTTYNQLNKFLAESTKYSEEAGSVGVFQGDSSVVSIQNAFRMLTQTTVTSATGAFTRLADVGIQMGNSFTGSAKTPGELVLDTAKLDMALNDLTSMKSLFAEKDDSAGQGGGIAVRFKGFTGGLMDLEGVLNNKDEALDKEKDRNSDEQERVQNRATVLEKRLRAQYTALDVKMASLSSLSAYVEQMVESWNNSKNK